jgi:hypothetical protein
VNKIIKQNKTLYAENYTKLIGGLIWLIYSSAGIAVGVLDK